MNSNIRLRLFLMMVMEFVIWGAWLPLIYGYLPTLGFSPTEQSWILNAFPISAILGMFFSTQFADRNFAAEKFLAFSHLIGGVAILGIGLLPNVWPRLGLASVPLFGPFFVLMLIHSLFYVPTISITNSIAFSNLPNTADDFPR